MILKNLFSSGNIGTLELKNRVILPAMGSKMADSDGHVSQQLIDYHVARTKGGCGLNIVEVAAIHPTTKAPYFIAIDDDKYILGLKKLTSAIKDEGGKSCIQIWHAGKVAPGVVEGYQRLAPSEVTRNGYQVAKEISKEEIIEIIDAYGDACVRAKKAGFDAVELHLGHGYLPVEFISKNSNRRTENMVVHLKIEQDFP